MENSEIILGTHNSATGGKLVWWQRPFGWLLHLTSRCQSKTIEEQLKDGVRLLNFQITKYKGEWHFSHGTTIYDETLYEVFEKIQYLINPEKPVYFQLFLDNNYFTGQDCEDFRQLVKVLAKFYKSGDLIMLYAWIEGSAEYPYKSDIKLSYEEHYWTLSWAKKNAKSILDRLPLPKRHARRYNTQYKQNCKSEILMLDFYDID